jgi:hypothetical protein
MAMETATAGHVEGVAARDEDPRREGAVSEWLPVGVPVVVAAMLSVPRLAVRPLWLDEAYSVGATNELLATWRQTGVTQALYYALLWPVTRLSTDPAWIRLPSALLGLAAVVIVYRLGRRMGGTTLGVLAAGGLALSWGLARYSLEARSYTLALLLVSIGWLAVVAVVQTPDDGARRRWWRILYVVTLLAPLAHGLAALNYVVQVGALAVVPGDRRTLARRALLVAPVLAVELAAMFLLGVGEVGEWVPPLGMWQVRTFKQLLLGFEVAGTVLGVLVAVAVIDVVRRFARERSRDAWLHLVPLFWALGPTVLVALISLVRPYAVARYVFPSLPGVFLLVAGLLVRHVATTRRVVVAALLLVPVLLLDQPRVTDTGIEDWPALTACIAANSAPGDRVVTAAAHRSALDYYWSASEHPELAALEPLVPPAPLGEVRRLYEPRVQSFDELMEVLIEDPSSSVWYVERLTKGHLGVIRLALDEQVQARYDLVEPWYFMGDLTLTRLDPKGGGRPRGAASCDTVPTPADMRPPDG